jgi:hypothetical protein
MNRGRDFGPRKGLEGPFRYPNGRVAYYDPVECKYYDPVSDFYLDDAEVADLKDLILDIIRR